MVSGTDNGTGVPATVTYTPAASGFGGLVLLDNSLTAGNVTVYADTTAPTGTVSVDTGSRTATTNVALTLSADDAQTGVMSMQISTDGTFDTEPVVPYSTSATATVPSGLGAKTIYVRYENNAGMWSDPVTANVNLVAKAKVTSVSPHTGPLGGGKTVTVKGSGFTGTTAVHFGAKSATHIHVVSDTKLTVHSPAHSAGTAHVTVTAAGAASSESSKDKYTYESKPSVSGLSPKSGSSSGGTHITVTGKHFLGASVVKFGSKSVHNFTVVSSTKITVKSPAHAHSTVYVRVKTPSGKSAKTNASKFTFN